MGLKTLFIGAFKSCEEKSAQQESVLRIIDFRLWAEVF